jgi:hypothetical protein
MVVQFDKHLIVQIIKHNNHNQQSVDLIHRAILETSLNQS